MSRRIRDLVVLVTGAGNGIGRALVREVHRRGGRVVAADVDAAALASLRADLGERVLTVTCDVTDLATVEAAMDRAVEHFGRLDVVVANAGLTQTVGTVEALPLERFTRTLDVNLTGVYRTMRASVRHLVRSRGHFVAVSSTAYGFNAPLQGHYAASKAGVHALANSFRTEMRWAGVTVGVVYPTFVAKADDQPDPDPDMAALGEALWVGADSGLFGAVPVREVVRRTIRGIERRHRTVVVPRRVSPVVWAPGLLRPLLERTFDDARVEDLVRRSRTLHAARDGHAPRGGGGQA